MELISKKELLSLYDISYGALYRWKRMGLIPEEWFIKKSTPTGQETFFHRAQICERIALIQSQKQTEGLERLAGQLAERANKQAAVVVNTVFGKKTFYLHEIHSILIDKGDGDVRDITKDIIGGAE